MYHCIDEYPAPFHTHMGRIKPNIRLGNSNHPRANLSRHSRTWPTQKQHSSTLDMEGLVLSSDAEDFLDMFCFIPQMLFVGSCVVHITLPIRQKIYVLIFCGVYSRIDGIKPRI